MHLISADLPTPAYFATEQREKALMGPQPGFPAEDDWQAFLAL